MHAHILQISFLFAEFTKKNEMGIGVTCIRNNVCSCLVPVLPGLSLNITVNTRECFWLAVLWVIGYSSTHFGSAQMEGGSFTPRPLHLQGKNPQY